MANETSKIREKRRKKIKKERNNVSREEEDKLRREAPTKMEHNFLIRPFETLTRMYGVPTYSEIDPTLVLFFTFPLIFGIMFGDIGHGITLIISGLIGGILFRKKKDIKNLSWIIFYCGFSAILFGFLYGEFFGQQEIFGYHLSPVPIPIPFFGNIYLFHPLENVMSLFLVAILLGVFHLNLGWILQFLNDFIQKKRFLALTDPLMKILFLDGGIFLLFRYGMDFEAWFAPPFPILLPIIPGILLIVFKIIGKMIGISYMEQESYGELLAEGSIEAFETLLSLPGNVFSYIRLLALALAHVSLMVAIRAMAGLIGGGSLISEIIIIIGLIFGNFIVILLEGLIVFLNALRLHFYEFFFKFYEGTGTEYKPFLIQNNYSNIKFQVETEKDIISEEIEKEIDTKEIKEVIDNAKDYVSEKYLE